MTHTFVRTRVLKALQRTCTSYPAERSINDNTNDNNNGKNKSKSNSKSKNNSDTQR